MDALSSSQNQSLPSLLAEVQHIQNQDAQASQNQSARELKTTRHHQRQVHQQKDDLLIKKSQAQKTETKLKLKKKQVVLDALLEKLKTKIKQQKSQMKDALQQNEQNQQTLKRVLQEWEQGQDQISQKESLGALSGSSSPAPVVSEALAREVLHKHQESKREREGLHQNFKKIQTAFQRQHKALSKQLEALKKMKFFKKLLRFVSAVTGPLLTAVTAGAASPLALALQKSSLLIKGLGQSLLSSVQGGFHSLLQRLTIGKAQRVFENHQNQEQKAFRHIQQNQKIQSQEFHRSQKAKTHHQKQIQQLHSVY